MCRKVQGLEMSHMSHFAIYLKIPGLAFYMFLHEMFLPFKNYDHYYYDMHFSALRVFVLFIVFPFPPLVTLVSCFALGTSTELVQLFSF